RRLANRCREQRRERIAACGVHVVDDERRCGRNDAEERPEESPREDVEAIDVARAECRQRPCGPRMARELAKIAERLGGIAVAFVGAEPQETTGARGAPRDRERALSGA